ncbi:hypothetical protein [Haloarcula sediminis]|uniref:hypothetical protein n=1 Tax=Haloarcula sediminis TaxID=3111777 RepID=UPI002D798B19|nr:hypothetical protein [Haloarcula sp. CK38]
MIDKTDHDGIEEAHNEEKAESPNVTDNGKQDTVEELVQTHLDTFVELAESDLPVAEDAERAIALTDGGKDL